MAGYPTCSLTHTEVGDCDTLVLVHDCHDRATWRLRSSDGWGQQYACDAHLDLVRVRLAGSWTTEAFPCHT